MKNKLKLFVVLAIILITICIFNTVQATEIPSEAASDTSTVALTSEDILALVPNALSIDMTDTESFSDDGIQVVHDKVKAKVLEELVSNGIDVEEKSGYINFKQLDMQAYVSNSLFEGEKNGFINKFVFVLQMSKSPYTEFGKKEITVTFTNSSNYNQPDEQYVKNKVANLNFDIMTWGSYSEEKYITEIKKLLNDTSLEVVHFGIASHGTDDISGMIYAVGITKNGVVYYSTIASHLMGTEIIIPEEIQDTEAEYIKYMTAEIEKNFSNTSISIEKITGDLEVYGYTIKNHGNLYKASLGDVDFNYLRFSARKASTTKVIDNISIANNSGVTINGENIAKDNAIYTEMQNKLAEKGFNNIFGVYELKVASGTITENGLTITFSLGTENNDKEVLVLHKKSDGTFEEFSQTVKNGKISITVKELSPFAIAFKGTQTNVGNTAPKAEIDNEPKEGEVNCIILASIMTIFSACGIAILKFKQ